MRIESTGQIVVTFEGNRSFHSTVLVYYPGFATPPTPLIFSRFQE